MLSYRHTFHAGNHADILKHITLIQLIKHFTQKEKPFIFIDTHAGAGRYALNSKQAEQTEEAKFGIQRLWQQKEKLSHIDDYWNCVTGNLERQGTITRYPGSPLIAAQMTRPQDKLVLIELHPKDSQLLRKNFQKDKRARVLVQDGFNELIAQLPPLMKRGLVLIDPPYEIKQDYTKVVTALQKAQRRWANGCYAIWYPLLSSNSLSRNMVRQIVQHKEFQNVLQVELEVKSPSARGMYGSGMLMINTPWKIDTQLKEICPQLSEALGEGGAGRWQVKWLKTPE